MILTKIVKKIFRKLDQLSPYPLFYPFLMSESEKLLFDSSIKMSRYYLEFGMGGSTIRVIQRSNAVIYTVDSSAEWIRYMRKYSIIRFMENKRLHIFPVHIGPVKGMGYPTSDLYKESFGNYSSEIFQQINGNLIDLALVDGRFRVACILKIIIACHENKKINILIHDFWDRPHYHIVLQYLDILYRADTLGLFSIKRTIDLTAVKKDYEAYKLIPD